MLCKIQEQNISIISKIVQVINFVTHGMVRGNVRVLSNIKRTNKFYFLHVFASTHLGLVKNIFQF